MLLYIVLGHYYVTNSSGTRLKLNYDFNCCKTIFFKILQSLKGLTIGGIVYISFIFKPGACQLKAGVRLVS